jgi:hypothetical protein
MAILEGTAYWASITTPNTTFEPVYTVNLVVDDETANEFASRGHKIKQMDEGPAVILKRKVNGPNGKIKVQFNEYSGEGKFGPYTGLDLQAVMITDLVPYKGADGEEFLSDGEEF